MRYAVKRKIKQKMCPKCNRLIGVNVFKRHFEICNGKKRDFCIQISDLIKVGDKYLCPYPGCNKKSNAKGIAVHYWCIHTEDGREHMKTRGGHKAWCKGLTKDTDERLAKIGKKIKEGYDAGRVHPRLGKHLTKEQKDSISTTLKDGYDSGRIIPPMLGKHLTAEQKDAIRKSLSNNPENPFYVDGRTAHGTDKYDYVFSLRVFKEQIRHRDWYKCVLCGKTQIGQKLEQYLKDFSKYSGLHVHHIDYNKKNNASLNLVALCSSCHGRTGTHREAGK